MAPLADERGFRRSHRSGAFFPAGVIALSALVTWGMFAYGRGQTLQAFSWSKFERIELPGDPTLNPEPGADLSPGLRLPPLSVIVPEPPVVEAKPASDATPSGTLETGVARAPALTPEEIEARARRYETWLRQRGLRRVGEVTTDVNNPY